MSHPLSKVNISVFGSLALSHAATTSGIRGASVHCFKAPTPLLYRPPEFKLPMLLSNSSTISSNAARRNSPFAVLVACRAVPTPAESGDHEQDRSKRKIFAASQL